MRRLLVLVALLLGPAPASGQIVQTIFAWDRTPTHDRATFEIETAAGRVPCAAQNVTIDRRCTAALNRSAAQSVRVVATVANCDGPGPCSAASGVVAVPAGLRPGPFNITFAGPQENQHMAVSVTSISTEDGLSGGTSTTVTVPTVAAGDLLIVVVDGRTNETWTITGISDTVNGAWSISGNISPEGDDPGGTARWYVAHRLNSAAGTNVDITVTISSAQTGFISAYALAGPETAAFEGYFTPLLTNGVTSHPSPDAISSGATGVMIGVLCVNSNRTTTFSAGTKGNSISGKHHLVMLEFTSAGSHTTTGTSSSNVRGAFHAAIFVTAGVAAGQPMAKRWGGVPFMGSGGFTPGRGLW